MAANAGLPANFGSKATAPDVSDPPLQSARGSQSRPTSARMPGGSGRGGGGGGGGGGGRGGGGGGGNRSGPGQHASRRPPSEDMKPGSGARSPNARAAHDAIRPLQLALLCIFL